MRWPVLLPPQRHRAVPWGGYEVVLAFIAYQFFWQSFFLWLLTQVHFYGWLYGSDFLLRDPALPGQGLSPADQSRQFFWACAFAFPFQLASIPLLLRRTSGARLYQLGLTTHRLGT